MLINDKCQKSDKLAIIKVYSVLRCLIQLHIINKCKNIVVFT